MKNEMKDVFKKENEPACKYCARGKKSADSKSVLCMKKGIVSPDFSCRSFKYDPLKREPYAAPTLQKDLKAEDFEL